MEGWGFKGEAMGARRKAREFSLKVLYQIDVCGKGVEDAISDGLSLIDHRGADTDYAVRLIKGVGEHCKEIDSLIRDVTMHWRLERMERIDKNILRIALFEILYCDEIPYKVAIDEAVELGKRYGTADSPSFINGILDSIVKKKVSC